VAAAQVGPETQRATEGQGELEESTAAVAAVVGVAVGIQGLAVKHTRPAQEELEPTGSS